MIILPKTSSRQLTFGLSAHEYACQCTYPECTNLIASEVFLEVYTKFRYLVDMPCYPTCGHRCHRNNFKIGGSKLSRHTSGEAIDLAAAPLLEKFSVEEIFDLAKKAGFNFVKYYPDLGIFHLDVRPLEA